MEALSTSHLWNFWLTVTTDRSHKNPPCFRHIKWWKIGDNFEDKSPKVTNTKYVKNKRIIPTKKKHLIWVLFGHYCVILWRVLTKVCLSFDYNGTRNCRRRNFHEEGVPTDYWSYRHSIDQRKGWNTYERHFWKPTLIIIRNWNEKEIRTYSHEWTLI